MSGLLFSVILPVYNVEAYLPACLDALLPQIEADTEVILIDDGSTDASAEICRQYAARYPVRLLRQENRGVAAARNAGVGMAMGEYIVWVDPDDLPAADLLAAVRAEIEGKDVLIFDYWECRGERRVQRGLGRPSGPLPRETALYELSRDDRLTSVLWNKVIRRESYLRHPFDEQLRCMEDYDILYRIVAEAEKIAYLARPLYGYRILNTGLVRSPKLDVAYRCVEKSKERYAQMKAWLAEPSRLGICLQAKGFLCKYYICQEPRAWREQANACRKTLWACRREICADRVLPLREKAKYMTIGLRCVGKMYARRKKGTP